MIKKAYFIFLFFVIACVNNKGVYWCGDHPCMNDKEKQAYFKKTMTVEVKEISSENYEEDSEMKKLLEQAKDEEKERILNEIDLKKKEKSDEKHRIKEEKELAKQAKLDEKRRIKEEKELAKQAKLDEKRRIKEEKELAKKIKLDEKKIIKEEKKSIEKVKLEEKETKIEDKNIKIQTPVASLDIDITNEQFDVIVEKIFKRNANRSYPEINDMPN